MWCTMTVTTIRHRQLLDYMTGAGALPLIRAALQSAPALAPSVGMSGYRYLTDYEVASWKVTSTHARPNAGASVTYRVNLIGRGEPLQVTTVASTESVPRGSSMVLRCDPRMIEPNAEESSPIPINVWTYPHDPHLAGLPWAADRAAISATLDVSNPVLETVVYRPTRRAMIKISEGGATHSWVKVLKPKKAQALLDTISVLEGSEFPYAPLLANPAPGIVVQAHGVGTPLANVISRKPYDAARMFDQIREVLDALPEQVVDLPRQKSWTDRRAHYAKAISQSLPDLTPAVNQMMRTINALVDEDQAPVPTHGDFFEANLLTNGTNITTVLDLDSVGPGNRADDYACLLAHVSVLPFLSPRRWISAPSTEPWRTRLDQFLPGKRCPSYPESESVLEAWRLRAEREVPAADLYARCAAVTLSLASSASLMWGEGEARARFARAQWWAELARESG